MSRRERTRRLIALGGLVEKSGVYPLLGDDPDATLYGALLALAALVRDDDGGSGLGDACAVWRRRGRRALRDPARETASHGM